MNTIRSSLEEGILGGGGFTFLALNEEITSWSSLNLIGDEFFASQIVKDALSRPYKELCANTGTNSHSILQKVLKKGYPARYDFLEKKVVVNFNDGILDSTKTTRAILWNSLSTISTIITSQ